MNIRHTLLASSLALALASLTACGSTPPARRPNTGRAVRSGGRARPLGEDRAGVGAKKLAQGLASLFPGGLFANIEPKRGSFIDRLTVRTSQKATAFLFYFSIHSIRSKIELSRPSNNTVIEKYEIKKSLVF